MVDRIYRNANPLKDNSIRIAYVSWVLDTQIRIDTLFDGYQKTYWLYTIGM